MGFRQDEVEHLLVRTGRMCAVCHQRHQVQVHHIVPREKGGNDDISNAIPLCPNCHDQVHATYTSGRTTRRYSASELRSHLAQTIAIVSQRAPGSNDPTGKIQSLPPLRLFLAYHHSDDIVLGPLRSALQKGQVQLHEARGLPVGVNHVEQLEREMDAADAIVALWTEDSVLSIWMQAEAAYGQRTGKLINLRVNKAAVPVPFTQCRSIDIPENAIRPALANAIALQLSALATELRAHRPHAAERAETDFRILSPRRFPELRRSLLVAISHTSEGDVYAEAKHLPELVVVETSEDEALISLVELLITTTDDFSSLPDNIRLDPELAHVRHEVTRLIRDANKRSQ